MALIDPVEQIEKMEDVRNRIVDVLVAADLTKLGVKELTLLEKTVTNGTKIAMARQDQEEAKKSAAGEEAFRQAATAFIIAKREEGNRRAQAIREGTLSGGAQALPELEARPLQENEGLQGQYQVSFAVLAGEKKFVPSENLPPAARDEEPEDQS